VETPDVIAAARQWLIDQEEIRHLPANDPRRFSSADLFLRVVNADRIIANLLAFLQGYEAEHRMLSLKVSELHGASTPGPDPGSLKHWTVAENLGDGSRAQAFVRALRALFKHTGHYRENGALLPMWPTTYDELFKSAAAQYAPEIGAARLKAQACRESGLDPRATNAASGAAGIAQFMLETWNDVSEQMRFPAAASRYDPLYAIPAQAFYMNTLWRAWHSKPRTDRDRWRLALASYDAGEGHIIDAQKLAGGALAYDLIIARLHQVTGETAAAETTQYVDAIEKIFSTLPAP
jgi:hypothetical protein